MSCLGCQPGTQSSKDIELENRRKKAKDYANEKQQTTIIYETEEGFFHCTEQYFFESSPGKFIEGVTHIVSEVTTG